MRVTFLAFLAFCLGLLLAPLAQAQSSNAGAAAGSLSGAQSQSGASSGAAAGATLIQNGAPIPANTTATTTLNQNYSGSYTQRLENTPNAIAPNIYPSANCHGSSSAGGGVPGFGISIGTSWQDDDCQYRETSRNFFQMGMKEDAVAVLCASPFAATAPACQALKPQPEPTASAQPPRKDAARDGDDTRTRTSKLEHPDVNLPEDAGYNTGIIAGSDGTLWKKNDGEWILLSSSSAQF